MNTPSFLRLALLEGVVAFHIGDLQEASKKLGEAQRRWQLLTPDPNSLTALQGMGFSEE